MVIFPSKNYPFLKLNGIEELIDPGHFLIFVEPKFFNANCDF